MLKKETKDNSEELKLGFTQINYILFGLSIFLTILGFWFMSQPPVNGFMTMTLSPFVLIFTYCILLPIAIIYRPKNSKQL